MAGDAQKFRPDLEGLRGAAILLVVLFHADVRAFAGGFVGVDVFFVLSGFFITGLLLRELEDTSTIDVQAFYGRRAMRLLPALLLVMLTTLALVMSLYAPIDRAPVASTGRSVALYSGNIEFARQSTDYFHAADNPLLHTWSLAVEEQFYLVWPLVLLLAWAGWSRWTRTPEEIALPSETDGDVNRRRLTMVIGLLGALSLLASVMLTPTSQSWAFFGMPTRIWEFALGGMLFLALRERRSWSSSARGIALQVGGGVAVVAAIALYDSVTPYPGIAAIFPALGGAALIAGGEWAPASAVSRALAASWLRWFGRLSYAWYLWHWPLVGLGAVLDPRIGVAGKLAWSGVALVLAWLTHRYVEQSPRDGALARIPERWVTASVVGASVAAAFVAHVALVKARRDASSPAQRTFAAARSDRMDHDCWATTVDDPRGACEFGDTRSSTVIALLGDSHAEHWLGALDRAGREHGWKIVAMVKGGCPVADMPRLVNARFKRYYHECTRYREAMVRRIIAMRPNAVILSSWDHYFPVNGKGASWQVTPEMWRLGLRRTYQRLTAAGLRTVAIRGTPRAWFDVPACLSRLQARVPFARRCEYDRAESLSPAAVRAQNDAARGLPVRFVDMNDQICTAQRCAVVRNGAVVFTDDNHLTASFSRTLAPVLGRRLALAFGF